MPGKHVAWLPNHQNIDYSQKHMFTEDQETTGSIADGDITNYVSYRAKCCGTITCSG